MSYTTIDVELEVEVRKHEVDTNGLKTLLKSHKHMSSKEIARVLRKPETLVAHWFRQDRYFAVPDADIWYDLKRLLRITTEEYDRQVTEFEVRGGNYDMRNRIYIGDTSPTLTAECGNHLHLLIYEDNID